MPENLSFSFLVRASVEKVWEYLTQPLLMVEWLGDPEMDIKVETNWSVGSPVSISGFHHIPFENKGIVLQFEPFKRLVYTHLSSLSRLEDLPENHTSQTFELSSKAHQTELTLELFNFPTASIRHHLGFYWRNTLPLLVSLAEKPLAK